MKIFKNKFLVKLIATICLFLTLLNFLGTSKVNASEDEIWGGTLIKPITNLLTGIGDAIMEILHKSIQEQDAAIIRVSGNTSFATTLASILAVVAGILAAVAFIAAIVVTGGLAAAAVGALTAGAATFTVSIGAGTVIAGAVAGICAGVAVKQSLIPGDIYLPAFSMTAEEIFANRIHLFDVNFFSPMPDQVVESNPEIVDDACISVDVYKVADSSVFKNKWYEYDSDDLSATERWVVSDPNDGRYLSWDTLIENLYTLFEAGGDTQRKYHEIYDDEFFPLDVAGHQTMFQILDQIINLGEMSEGDVRDLTVNFIMHEDDIYGDIGAYAKGVEMIVYDEDEPNGEQTRIIFKKTNVVEREDTILYSTAGKLKEIISAWYFVLRNIALLVLMLILVYTGIRIVIGSTSGEKAKYKERLMDWLVAICLLMIMHYIMIFAVSLVEKITELLATTTNGNAAYIQLTEIQQDNAEKVLTGKFAEYMYDEDGDGNNDAIEWPTDLAGLFRIQAQLEKEGTANWVGYSFCYVVLVLYTLFFAFTYVRRVLYMAFLTMIAPLVAMTYPIDKMTDGKAQAFDTWLKEYIFNLMIQPLHLLLYTILVSSAYTLASESPIYALVAVGFMMPAEKLMRRFFGFEKAKTPGLLGGAAGAAIAMSGLQKVLGGHKHHGGKQDGNSGGKAQDKNSVKLAKKSTIDEKDTMYKESGINQAGGPTTADKEPNSNGDIANQEDERLKRYLDEGGKQNSSGAYYRMDIDDYDENYDPRTDTSYDLHADKSFSNDQEEQPQPAQQSNINNAANGQQTNPTNNNPDKGKSEKTKKKRHLMRAVGRATLGVGKQAAVGVLTGIHPLRMAGKIATGATGAAAGLVLGVASGDPSKAFQYATGGAVAGSALAGSLSGGKNILTDDLKENVKMSYYGEDYSDVYKEKIREQQKKQLYSKENIKYLRQIMEVDDKGAKKILEDTGAQCFDNGITDIGDIAAIHQLTHPKEGEESMSFDKAIAARSYAKKRLGGADIDQMTDDQVKEYKNRWANEYKERYKNLTKDQALALADQSFDAAIRFNKARSKITKI